MSKCVRWTPVTPWNEWERGLSPGPQIPRRSLVGHELPPSALGFSGFCGYMKP